MKRLRDSSGFTMVEMTVVMTIMAIIFLYAIPQYRVAMEQAKVDFAATTLKSIWTAERMYWVNNHVFCGDLETLESNQLVEAGFTARVNASTSPFRYSILSADANTFTAMAESNLSSWTGQFTISEQGGVSGQVTGHRGEVVTATEF